MRILVAVISLLFSQLSPAATEGELSSGLVNPGYHEQPDWFKESFLDLREDVQEAAAQNRRVMLYFYQDGCPYCAKLLKDNFGNPQIAKKTRKHFDVIAINLWGDREVVNLDGQVTTEKQFAESLKVQYTPTLLFLNEQGKVVVRLNGYYEPDKFDLVLNYVAGKHEKEMKLS
ncbi:thioredoxin family protein, partial [Thiolapillus sp.]